MELFSIVNQRLVPASEASLLTSDLAIQRGYGVFDFFKTLGGKPIFLTEHLDRFYHSAERLRLPIGMNRAELRELIDILGRKNGLADSGFRLTLTGGYSGDGYLPPASPNLIISQSALTNVPTAELSNTIKLVSYSHRRQLPDIKTIDYLMAIWLQPFIKEHGADDVLYHQDGVITECPRSNFFAVTAEGVVVTPAQGILRGIIRGKALELARGKFRVEERDVTLEDLRTAREAFITSTTKHVLPVVEVDGMEIGGPGEVSRWLSRELYALVGKLLPAGE
jgi:branched-chain amino acid aminotransferase